MVRTQIQLTEEQVSSLKKMAASRKLSVAELIRQAVKMLIKSGGAVDAKERYRRALRAAGKFRSSVSDLSSRHDDYLSETLQK